jgi:transcriptional regulator with XRE-family HTH domain
MAKFKQRLQARILRKKGLSVKDIARQIGVSKSTISVWTRDIVLTIEQLEDLRKSMLKGAELGRFRSAKLKREKRLATIERLRNEGIRILAKIDQRELLIAGLGLYWGEGSKKGREFSFCNSDPEMVKFFLIWLKNCFGIQAEDLKCSIGINHIHTGREEKVKNFWMQVLGVKADQFTKTTFKKTNNGKVYENFNDHYGTIRIRIKKPGELYYKVIGLIEGLKYNMPG